MKIRDFALVGMAAASLMLAACTGGTNEEPAKEAAPAAQTEPAPAPATQAPEEKAGEAAQPASGAETAPSEAKTDAVK